MNALDIKNIRKKLGLTQKQLAEMIGVDPKTIQNWEYGKNIPQSKSLILGELMGAPSPVNITQNSGNFANGNGNNIKSTVQRGESTVLAAEVARLKEALDDKEKLIRTLEERLRDKDEIIALLKGK